MVCEDIICIDFVTFFGVSILYYKRCHLDIFHIWYTVANRIGHHLPYYLFYGKQVNGNESVGFSWINQAMVWDFIKISKKIKKVLDNCCGFLYTNIRVKDTMES